MAIGRRFNDGGNAVDLLRLELLKRVHDEGDSHRPRAHRRGQTNQRGRGLVRQDPAVAVALSPVCHCLARFRGNERPGDFIDNRQYWGQAFPFLAVRRRSCWTTFPSQAACFWAEWSERTGRDPPRAAQVVRPTPCVTVTAPSRMVWRMYDDHLEIITRNAGLPTSRRRSWPTTTKSRCGIDHRTRN